MIAVALTFVSGVLTALTDRFSDANDRRGISTGVVYGLILGFLISQGGAAGLVLAGGFLGVLAAGKFDSVQHASAGVATAAALGIFGVPPFNLTLLFLFSLASLADEKVDGMLEKKKMPITRPVLPVAALAASVAMTEWAYLTTIVAFDLGYLAVTRQAITTSANQQNAGTKKTTSKAKEKKEREKIKLF